MQILKPHRPLARESIRFDFLGIVGCWSFEFIGTEGSVRLGAEQAARPLSIAGGREGGERVPSCAVP